MGITKKSTKTHFVIGLENKVSKSNNSTRFKFMTKTTVRALAEEHTAQVLGYLRASNIEHAMLINFGAPRIEFRKFILRSED